MTKNAPAPYVYQPYPKWIKDNNGKDVIVQDNLEHREVLGCNYVHDPKWDTGQESKREKELEIPIEMAEYAKEYDLLPGDIPDTIPQGVIGVPVYDDNAVLDPTTIELPKSVLPVATFPDPEAKDTLLKQADALGIYYDKRWGAGKLKAAIDEAMS